MYIIPSMDVQNRNEVDQVLLALGEQLQAQESRIEIVVIGGSALRAHFAGRIDQIHFKLYAMADGMAGKHEADPRALEPTERELLTAARWTLTHDPSEGFRSLLLQALAAFGIEDADLSS